MATVHERIRQARESSDLSRAELARRVGVKPSAAVQWEQKGGTSPHAKNLAKVAAVTKVAFEWLATGRGMPHLATAETSAIDSASFAHSLFEERLLELGRLLPHEARAPLLKFLEGVTSHSRQTHRR